MFFGLYLQSAIHELLSYHMKDDHNKTYHIARKKATFAPDTAVSNQSLTSIGSGTLPGSVGGGAVGLKDAVDVGRCLRESHSIIEVSNVELMGFLLAEAHLPIIAMSSDS